MGAPRLLACLLVVNCTAVAQLVAEFHLDKSVFAPREPVLLRFQVTNNGPKPINILLADPYTFCSGYQIAIANDPDSDPHSSCARGILGSCLSSSTTLRPGESRTETVLLNFEHNIANAGDYSIDAGRMLPYADAAVEYFKIPKQSLEVRTKLYFRVDSNLGVPPEVFENLVRQLHSPDSEKRTEAARTLAAMASPDQENTLLGLADVREFRQFAPLAFHNLNTPRSMDALADLLAKTESGTYENMQSAEYLAQSGDKQWFPLLLELARRKAGIVNYVIDAAELGEEAMLPPLIELMTSKEKQFTNVNAISGLGYTHTREAIPILLKALRSKDPGVSEFAGSALQVLTHRITSHNPDETPESRFQKWSQWWDHEGATAPIYRGNECEELAELP